MHVTIDLDRMAAVHKHSDFKVLANLAWIELHHAAIHILPTESKRGFSRFTHAELQLIYRNATGFDHSGADYNALIQCVYNMLERMPITEVNGFEAEVQASAISEDDSSKYRYVKGSSKPAQMPDLFAAAIPQIKRSENDSLTVPGEPVYKAPTTPGVVAQGSRPVAQAASTPAPRATPNTSSAPVAVQQRAAPGSTREKVWTVADEMWEAAGKPTEKSTVLKLRKEMMERLETEGVKKTSSSNELGKWQLARIIN